MDNKVKLKDLGQRLVEAKLIDHEKLQHIMERHARENLRIQTILINEGLVTALQLQNFLSGIEWEVPFVNLKKKGVKQEAVSLIPESLTRMYGIIGVELSDNQIMLAMEEPWDIYAIDVIEAHTRRKVVPLFSSVQDISEMIDLNYKVSEEIEEQLSQIPFQYRGLRTIAPGISTEAITQAPIVRTVDLIIRQAIKDRASDIHLEPQEDKLRVRYRIDGILHEFRALPIEIHQPLLSRIKIMAGLNIAERRRPQDGQITFSRGDRQIDIRVATSNTVHGEMAVLRILDKTFAFLPLAEIGFLPEILERYVEMLKIPFGIILISGPTGSGKTTTQYATVHKFDAIGRNILTIEDPVEYRFNNINQMQVNPAAGFTFATGLRAALRLDPNIILVGEIRDTETAQIATQASLTGHLVLSSIHANDTVGAIFRMIDLGVEPFLLSAALIGVVAQRMVRKICSYCSKPTKIDPDAQLAYEKEMQEQRTEFMVGAGCNICSLTGYFGRTGIFEILLLKDKIRKMILSGASTEEIRIQAYKEGTISLWRDGMLKVKAGITTPKEVMRNVFSIG